MKITILKKVTSLNESDMSTIAAELEYRRRHSLREYAQVRKYIEFSDKGPTRRRILEEAKRLDDLYPGGLIHWTSG